MTKVCLHRNVIDIVFFSLPQCLHHRGVNPGAPLPPMEPWLKRMLDRPQAVSARCRAPLQEMKKLFSLKEVVQKKGQKTSADVFGNRYKKKNLWSARKEGSLETVGDKLHC